MGKKACPTKKIKRKGACRTAAQKAGDAHRKKVMKGLVKPYSEGGRRTKKSGSTKRKTTHGIKYWCADARKNKMTGNKKMTMCQMMQNRRDKMNAFWAKKKGLVGGASFVGNFAGTGLLGLGVDPSKIAGSKGMTVFGPAAPAAPPTVSAIKAESNVPDGVILLPSYLQ